MSDEANPMETTETELDFGAAPPGVSPVTAEGDGLNVPLLAAILIVMALVAISNVWLRRRAQRETDDQAT